MLHEYTVAVSWRTILTFKTTSEDLALDMAADWIADEHNKDICREADYEII
jgi:hypothetical protein